MTGFGLRVKRLLGSLRQPFSSLVARGKPLWQFRRDRAVAPGPSFPLRPSYRCEAVD